MYHNTSSIVLFLFFFFKQKTAYEMRISDWSSDVCSSDLYKRKVGNAWVDVTAGVFAAQVTAVAKGLIAIGVEQGDRVGLMSATRFEWPLVDYAIWADRKSVVSGKSVSVRVDLGGRRIIKKKKREKRTTISKSRKRT